MNETLDSKEAAELLKLSVTETLRLARVGEFPGISWGNKWTFLKEDLLDWLSQKAKSQQRERLAEFESRQVLQDAEPRKRGRRRKDQIEVVA